MNFSDLQLNTNLKETLSALEKQNRMPHALIISGGSEGVRSQLCGHIAAWAVCNSRSGRPCGLCKNCMNAMERSHSDIYYASSGGKTKIYSAEELKRIVRDASIKPNQADRKVYIFEECDKKLPEISQNILLKTLEEPPQDILFILTCENDKVLLETIRSRAATLFLGDEREMNSERSRQARDILNALFSSNELDLLKETYKLSERFSALETLDCIVNLLSEGLSLRCGYESGNNPETAQLLCGKLTKAQFLELIEVTRSAQQKINQHLGMELVSTWLCAKYRAGIN